MPVFTFPFRALAAAALVFALAGTPAAAETVTVDITRFAYAPQDITVAPGTTVVWTNRDEIPHTVTRADKQLASKALDTGDRYEHTFSDAGDYDYYCAVHPFMTGVVHVRKP